MRITQASEQTQFLSSLDTLESNISQTQNQISTGLAFTTPAENPAAAGAVDNYQQVLAQSKQYTSNANSAQDGLNTEGTALSQVTSQLQSLRDLALQANSGTESSQNLAAIATQAQQIQTSLLSLANTQDGSGNYIFAGFASQTQPFSLTSTGASYAGDTGQLQVQVAAAQTIATGDNGNTVFNNIKTGNGTFAVAAAAANTGAVVVGASTASGTPVYDGKSFTIKFTVVPATGLTANSYQILEGGTPVTLHDSLGNAVTTLPYASGQAINYDGVQTPLTGQPAIGDNVNVVPSTNQSLFTTVQNLVTALQSTGSTSSTATAQLNNSINSALDNIDQALSQVSTVQSSVGGRLNSITTQLTLQSSQQLQLTSSISSLQGLDYASAITSLESQNTTLSAAMQAFTMTQGLTLFKYIQ